MVWRSYERLQLLENYFIQSDQKWENYNKFDIKISSARYKQQNVTVKKLQNSNKTLDVLIFHVTLASLNKALSAAHVNFLPNESGFLRGLLHDIFTTLTFIV